MLQMMHGEIWCCYVNYFTYWKRSKVEKIKSKSR